MVRMETIFVSIAKNPLVINRTSLLMSVKKPWSLNSYMKCLKTASLLDSE
jgi:hypothetical protein